MNVFELYAKLGLNTEDYSRGLNNAKSSFSKVSSGLKRGFSVLSKASAAAFGATATGLGMFVKSATESYSQYEQLVGGVETLFKKSADTVKEYANDAYKSAGMSANEYMDTITSFSASLLQGLGGDTKKATSYADMAIRDMSDNANKMGTNIEMIQLAYQGLAKQNYTMLDNLKLGYGGTQKEMFRLMSDAKKIDKSFDAVFSIDEKGHLEANFHDMVKAIHIVQENLDITGTTSKEAEHTIEGSFKAMKSSFENLKVSFAGGGKGVPKALKEFTTSLTTYGKNILPVVKTIFSNLTSNLEPAIKILFSDVLPVVRSALIDLLSSTGKALITSAPLIFESLKSLVKMVIDMFESNGGEVIERLVNFARYILSQIVVQGPQLVSQAVLFISGLLNSIFAKIGEYLPQVVPMLVTIISNLFTMLLTYVPTFLELALNLVRNVITGLISALPATIQTLFAQFPVWLQNLTGILKNFIPKLVDTVIEIFNNIVDTLPGLIDEFEKNLPSMLDGIGAVIEDLLPVLLTAGKNLITELVKRAPDLMAIAIKLPIKIMSAIFKSLVKLFPRIVSIGKGFVTQSLTGAKQMLPVLLDGLKEGFKKMIKVFKIDKVIEVGKNIVRGIWTGIQSMAKWVADKVGGFADGLVSKMKKTLGIHSPSKIFAAIGRFMAEGLGLGWTKAYKKVQAVIMDGLSYEADIDSNVETGNSMFSQLKNLIVDLYESNNEKFLKAMENTTIEVDGKTLGRAVRHYA